MINERYNLCVERIKEISKETAVKAPFDIFFKSVADFIIFLEHTEENKEYNKRLYIDIIPDNYEKSFANPDYIKNYFLSYVLENLEGIKKTVKNSDDSIKEDYKKLASYLCYLYSEIRGLIPYVYENNKEIVTIYLELFVEIYVSFSNIESAYPKPTEIKDIIYWFNSDNSDIVVKDRIEAQIDPERDFATKIIMESDLSNPDYLYKYGEYVTDNEIKVVEFLCKQPESVIKKMADAYTEGYRIGFIKTGKRLDIKETVNIRYNLGFERVIKQAILNFEEMGLKPVIYRAAALSLISNGYNKVGFYGAIANKQYDYDHKEDNALFLDKDFVNRKVLVSKNVYEENKDLAAAHAGPAVMEVFGEIPFDPVSKESAINQGNVERKCSVDLRDRLGQLANEYLKGEERSFTIIAFPTPEIGEDFEKIFAETIELNTLDYVTYENLQQIIIDALDETEAVRIKGKGKNVTDLTVRLIDINDVTKETKFENCVADVNIPVGEVFTSPVLKGTNGILNVTEVYLNGLKYKDFKMSFEDGMIKDYSCGNFEDINEGRKYINDNVLFHHETLPIGEFAIGTNTTAYKMAKKYNIENRLPILIGEKTGPHFAVGDTCYSHAEDIKVYNADGKEIMARDNEITIANRKNNPSKAYFNCHTDITIPYDELECIEGIKKDGSVIKIIQNGKFVLEGLEELNRPLID